MTLFADYEGLGVILSEFYWFVATVLAALCALVGTIAGALRVPRCRLSLWLGVIACCMELAAAALVQVTFLDTHFRYGEYAERFRPGWVFWSLSLGTTVLALLALGLGIFRRPRSQGQQSTMKAD